MSRPVITLTTDFGQVDGYVGTMKGVILSICPEAALVDISHEIQPQAVRQAAYVLSTAVPYFPPQTVHLVVVDPDVGGERRPIAVKTGRASYVAPDNGVLSMVLAQDPAHLAVHLTASSYCLPEISATFHGRDIFAPAAAYLACGADPRKMGTLLPGRDIVTLPILKPRQQPDGSWLGEVVHIDRFGNLITNIQSLPAEESLSMNIGGKQIVGLRRTFADVAPGEWVAYIGSNGYLEIAVREGNAAARLGTTTGDAITVQTATQPTPGAGEDSNQHGITLKERG
jgi:S-adenosylmethionine hydrolase